MFLLFCRFSFNGKVNIEHKMIVKTDSGVYVAMHLLVYLYSSVKLEAYYFV